MCVRNILQYINASSQLKYPNKGRYKLKLACVALKNYERRENLTDGVIKFMRI